jgi:hypothetical protein
MKDITANTQFLNNIISNNIIYVDKTKYVYNLLTKPQPYFLCRPRRFGKSLLLDTLAEALSGNKELFDGLYLGLSDYNFKKYPVIRLSMTYIETSSTDLLISSIISKLLIIAKLENIDIKRMKLDSILKDLIFSLYQKYNSTKVAILIDEYDAPILDNIANIEVAQNNLAVLHTFYRSFKDLGDKIYFVFVTGISQMARTPLGYTSLNLNDISLSEDYAGICGFTKDELDRNFGERYEETLEHMIGHGTMNPGDTIDDLRHLIWKWALQEFPVLGMKLYPYT